ncbi:PHP-associated domain-containing protein [Pelotomaculum propionicicum]|uniref:PHP-associated domain-containing protein n=1 Tax=Pelotomaculum propionicicum TaxID=258475 RepID=UPI003B75D7ED
MLIDAHLHEKKFSADSFISLDMIIKKADELGLDGICITDHDSNAIRAEAAALSKKTGVLIITGAEVLTLEGDMTVFGLDRLPEKTVHANELIRITEAAGGVAICSHPYRQNNRGMGDFIRDLPLVRGIEAFNGSTPKHHNLKAYDLSLELNVAALGGSDAHVIDQVGKFATWMPDWVRDESSFIHAVKRGLTLPAAYNNGSYEVYGNDFYYKEASF